MIFSIYQPNCKQKPSTILLCKKEELQDLHLALIEIDINSTNKMISLVMHAEYEGTEITEKKYITRVSNER